LIKGDIMTQYRRDFLKKSAAFSALALSTNLFSNSPVQSKVPHRFIFLRKSSGLFPSVVVPKSFSEKEKSAEKELKEMDIDLRSHELGGFLTPLNKYKENIGIIQGMSGKMMSVDGHWPAHSAMNLCDSKGAPERASIDFEMAKLFPSIFNHIGLACCESKKSPMTMGYSSKAAQVPNFVYRTPKMALVEIFGAAASKQQKAQFKLSDHIYKFIHERQSSKVSKNLSDQELLKVESYRQYANEIIQRNRKLVVQADLLKPFVPKLSKDILGDDPSVVDRQAGHFEIATQALLSGLTNIATINFDSNDSYYTIGGLENSHVHGMGHNPNQGGFSNGGARRIYETYHSTLIAKMISKFKNVKEGNGTFFDNTTILYFSDCGEKHHPKCNEWPFVVISGKNSPLKLKGRYLRFPKRGENGHRHLGNFYTTLLNAHGSSIEHYGPMDYWIEQKKIDQVGSIKEII
jgi:hypothetical protein